MPYKKLKIEIKNRVAYILLDSGARFNKLSITTIRELKQAFAGLEADDNVGCIVITGYPGESFAAGADIAQMRDFTPAEAFAFGELGQSLFDMMESSAKPIIGALNGITMGGGVDLALACDIRIASESLMIAHPGAKLGIITGFCGTQKLPRLVGKNRAREIFMTSDPYSAQDALRMGLVNRVCAVDRFWGDVTDFAAGIARHSADAFRYAKKLVNASEDVDLKNGCAMELGIFSSLFSSEVTCRKMKDFLDRKRN